LPVTNFHFDNKEAVKKVLYGRVKLVHATALLRFEKKGIVQQLLHKLKYKGYEDIGLFLGEWLATELKETGEYDDIDIVISVPLHKRKLKKRGYNQVEKFAKAIANSLEVPYNNQVLQKLSSTTTQVFKKRISRWNDKDEVFKLVDSGLIENKHILLCDDIITTGATIEACANELLKATNVKISVVTMAIA
jgi:ComF family protein